MATLRRPAARSERSMRPSALRAPLVLVGMLAVFVALGARVVHLHTVQHDYLRAQGDARHVREVMVMPERGMILDRNRQVLTVSTPVDSLSATPALLCKARDQWGAMLELIAMDAAALGAACEKYRAANFMYIKRRLPPALAKRVLDLQLPGVAAQREYKRYYPQGPAGAHLIGFTDVDEVGQEGVEAAYDDRLRGTQGRIRVLKDLNGNHVESVENIRAVTHGRELVLSIDQRVQSLAGDYLAAAVAEHRASSGSAVVVAVPSGEILAMVNSPQFNPNDRSSLRAAHFRNRSITDVFEPGSTVKPFTIAMALDSGRINAATPVDTRPGHYRLGDHTISDVHDYGVLSVADVIVHSSNVGMARIADMFSPEELHGAFAAVGLGQRAGSLPGESAGILKQHTRPVEHATLSYGYGLSVTALQLARAYTVFATDGELLPLTLERQPPHHRAAGVRVFRRDTVAAVRAMLERAASAEGTASRAPIPRYRIGGKTGTTHKIIDGRYHEERYISMFAGLAPLSDPRFVVVVTVDDPHGERYYGGDVAAPVFARLATDLMRLYNIPPDRRDAGST